MFCECKFKNFPDSEFYKDARWGWIHDVPREPHTVTDTPVGPPTGEVVDPAAEIAPPEDA